MGTHWLGEVFLDRWVRRSLRRFNSASLEEVHAEVCKKLHEEHVVQSFQILPDENDVWCSLQRLVTKGVVEKYVLEYPLKRIKYRIKVMK